MMDAPVAEGAPVSVLWDGYRRRRLEAAGTSPAGDNALGLLRMLDND